MIINKTNLFLSLNLLILTLISPLNISQEIKNSFSPEIKLPENIKLPGFVTSPDFDEQVCTFNFNSEIRVLINASSMETFDKNKPAKIILYALPNGNTIEQTIGKHLLERDDWHFDIQHIGAQMRFLRNQLPENNLVIVYLESFQKSWPLWKSKHSDYTLIIDSLIGYLTDLFSQYNPAITLTGHSGGGSFTFGYLDGVTKIPNNIERIAFLDSDYGYEHKYGDILVNWINESPEHYLSVIAYNDSVALYNDKPVVSATGGTWFRSKMLKNYLENYFEFTTEENDEFITYSALNSRIKIILKKNPDRIILHTKQVELNGFIQSMVSGTKHEGIDYKYFGERSYSQFIYDGKVSPGILKIPPRPKDALSGSHFMNTIMNLSFEEREQEIYNQVSMGNIPEFLRSLTKITSSFLDADGKSHIITYEVMPDYLAVGSDEDFCRVPVGPLTAQKIADLLGAILPTRKLVDDIYKYCVIKLEPVPYLPVGDENTYVSKFIIHNKAIQNQFIEADGSLGQLTGGIKKDVVLSNLVTYSTRKNNVVIYGWHKLDGLPIQPLTNIHKNTYVDYSHGIRLLNDKMILDGVTVSIKSILNDPILYKLLSDEDEPMIITNY